MMCKTCVKKCDLEMYRENLVEAIGLFLNGVNLKSRENLNLLENTKNSTVFNPSLVINSFFDYNGFDVTKSGPFCLHN